MCKCQNKRHASKVEWEYLPFPQFLLPSTAPIKKKSPSVQNSDTSRNVDPLCPLLHCVVPPMDLYHITGHNNDLEVGGVQCGTHEINIYGGTSSRIER